MHRRLALILLLPLAAQASDFLDPNQAFRLAAKGVAPGSVELLIDIRPGHYMYRERFRVQTESRAEIALDALPVGERKFDEAFQREMEVHRGVLRVKLAVGEATQTLRVTGQGCADKGLCYAPMTSTLVAGANGAWTLQPGPDPVGEFGPAPSASVMAASPRPVPAEARSGVLAALTLGLWALLIAARRF